MSELLFRSMGTEAHVVVAGGHEALADAARRRLFDLERRWSRFLPDSEVSHLNARTGEPVAVSSETRLLVERAVEAWRITGGSFDPTVLGDVLRAGYDRPFDEVLVGGAAAPAGSDLVTGCTDIEVDSTAVRLPRGVGFDAGGIGKGLAADLVATEVMASGASGVCVNIGGDLRVLGETPDGSTWTVAIEHPSYDRPLTHVGLEQGAVATSTVLRRRWSVDGEVRHHLIDPRTGSPSTTDLTLATVVAGEAWMAEVLAKAVLLRGGRHPFDLIDDREAAALVVDERGRARISAGFNTYRGMVAA